MNDNAAVEREVLIIMNDDFSEIVTNLTDILPGFSYTVARVMSGGHCVELHYCDKKAWVESSIKIKRDCWEGTDDYADWFSFELTEDKIIQKLESIFIEKFPSDQKRSKHKYKDMER